MRNRKVFTLSPEIEEKVKLHIAKEHARALAEALANLLLEQEAEGDSQILLSDKEAKSITPDTERGNCHDEADKETQTYVSQDSIDNSCVVSEQ